MYMIKTEYGFQEYLDHDVIQYLDCNCFTGVCQIHDWNFPLREFYIGCSCFNMQYGIPVSQDGTTLFICTWENGVRAYDIPSGNIRWEWHEKNLTHIHRFDEILILVKTGKGIFKLDAVNGTVLGELKFSGIEYLKLLKGTIGLAWKISGNVQLINLHTLKRIKMYRNEIINPNKCLSILIQDAIVCNHQVIISGIEKYPLGNYKDKNDNRFTRRIDYI